MRRKRRADQAKARATAKPKAKPKAVESAAEPKITPVMLSPAYLETKKLLIQVERAKEAFEASIGVSITRVAFVRRLLKLGLEKYSRKGLGRGR